MSDERPRKRAGGWDDESRRPPPDGYPEMVAALRELADRVASAAPDPGLIADVTKSAAELSARLAEAEVTERHQVAGRIRGAADRGQTLVPALADLVETGDDPITSMSATVVCGRHYLGGNGAVYGGVLPMLFDEIMGRLANSSERPVARTAYLNTAFRAITPIDRPLRLTARIDREEGRKRFLTGTLHDGDTLCAEADALFLALMPGQR